MSLERLNELKAMVSACIDDQYSCDDLTRLINAEIRKIESRRKVPLVPCRCGCKRIKQWRSQTYGYVYRCDDCDEGFEYRQTDKEARIAWNEAQKGGET